MDYIAHVIVSSQTPLSSDCSIVLTTMTAGSKIDKSSLLSAENLVRKAIKVLFAYFSNSKVNCCIRPTLLDNTTIYRM